MGQPPSNEFDQEKLLNSGSSSALRAVPNENKLLEAEHHAGRDLARVAPCSHRLLLLWSRLAQVLSPLSWRNSSH